MVRVSPSASVSSAFIASVESLSRVIDESRLTVSVSSTATGSLSLIPVTVNESSAVEVSLPSLTV